MPFTETLYEEKDKEIYNKLHLEREVSNYISLNFEKLKDFLSDDEIIYSVRWYKEHIKGLLQFLQKYDTTLMPKRKVQSILEEL